jgi:hypothetical protein
MNFVTEIIPIVNTVVLFGGAFIVVSRVGDMLKRVEKANEDLQKIVGSLDKRVLVVETVCRINHPREKGEENA